MFTASRVMLFLRNGVRALETNGIFVWTKPPPVTENQNQKGVTIEDAIIKLVKIHGDELKSLFSCKNAALN